MASTQNFHLLSPSLRIKPSAIVLGSVIANVMRPWTPLSNDNLPTEIDTEIHTEEEKNFVGQVNSKGPLAVFKHSFGSSSSECPLPRLMPNIEYSCESTEVRRFEPSAEFMAKVVADPAVKSHLENGGIGAEVFVVTGVMIAERVAITTGEGTGMGINFRFRARIPVIKTMVHGNYWIFHSKTRSSSKSFGEPIVFAYQVEKLWVTMENDHAIVVGALRREETECLTGTADEGLNDEDMGDLDLEARDGLDENGEKHGDVSPSD